VYYSIFASPIGDLLLMATAPPLTGMDFDRIPDPSCNVMMVSLLTRPRSCARTWRRADRIQPGSRAARTRFTARLVGALRYSIRTNDELREIAPPWVIRAPRARSGRRMAAIRSRSSFPCHRLIGADGSLTATVVAWTKQSLLALEGRALPVVGY